MGKVNIKSQGLRRKGWYEWLGGGKEEIKVRVVTVNINGWDEKIEIKRRFGKAVIKGRGRQGEDQGLKKD